MDPSNAPAVDQRGTYSNQSNSLTEYRNPSHSPEVCTVGCTPSACAEDARKKTCDIKTFQLDTTLIIWSFLPFADRFKFKRVSTWFKDLFLIHMDKKSAFWLGAMTYQSVVDTMPLLPHSYLAPSITSLGMTHIQSIWRKLTRPVCVNNDDMTLYAVVRDARDDNILASCHTRCSNYSLEEDFWSFRLDLTLHVNQTDVWMTRRSLPPEDIRWKLNTILELYILTSHGYKNIRREMRSAPNRTEQWFEDDVGDLMILQYNDYIDVSITDISIDISSSSIVPYGDTHPWDSILQHRLILDTLLDDESSVEHTNQCGDKNRLVDFMTSIGLAADP